MATTGFWPVKGKLKEVIDYAQNPDKTIDKKFVDSDLYAALQYASDDRKTDQKMFVTGINCNSKRAYQRMMATKKRFGKNGGNVAYHGYQSFKTGEVTPEEAHKIGIKTAKKMWGDKYEVIVTTHLNTDNLHNHFVVNSVSFKDGKKFENHISDHYRLREISDEICREYNKSVMENSHFYGGDKKDYWMEKNNRPSRKQQLKADIDLAISYSILWQEFEIYIKRLGYQITRGGRGNFQYSLKSKDWQRAIRIERLGKQYSPEMIKQRLENNRQAMYRNLRDATYTPENKKYTRTPILTYEQRYRKLSYELSQMDSVELIYSVITELIKLIVEDVLGIPITPEFRKAVKDFNVFLDEYRFLKDNGIETGADLAKYIDSKSSEIVKLSGERQSVYNQNRHKKSPELNARAREISAEIKPLRKELNKAKDILERYPKLQQLLLSEKEKEEQLTNRNIERSR